MLYLCGKAHKVSNCIMPISVIYIYISGMTEQVGTEGRAITLLIDEAQIIDDAIMADINLILTAGDCPAKRQPASSEHVRSEAFAIYRKCKLMYAILPCIAFINQHYPVEISNHVGLNTQSKDPGLCTR